MEGLRKPCYLSITDVPVGLVRYANKVPQGDVRSILQPCDCYSFGTSRMAIVKPLTRNDKRSERDMSTEKK